MEELAGTRQDVWLRAADEIAALAAARGDGHDADPGAGIEVLRRYGLLAAPMRPEGAGYVYDFPWRLALPAFVALGGADLSLGRLFEGHANALQLVALYGDAGQRARVRAGVEAGALMGVWGADGARPFTAEPFGGEDGGEDGDGARAGAGAGDAGALRLGGEKRYASGLGHVGLALVPHGDGAGRLRLLLLDVGGMGRADAGRLDASSWRMRGMRASRSGTFRFEGLTASEADLVGAPDDYRREPFFMGGIWRCAAVQLGAVERIVAGLAGELRALGRLDHPLQSARVGEAILAARDARLQVEAAAEAVEGGRPGELAASLAVFARLRVEAAGLAAIGHAERGLGLAAFADAHPLARPIRDLSTYLRQANPDAVLLEHARRLAARLPEIFR